MTTQSKIKNEDVSCKQNKRLSLQTSKFVFKVKMSIINSHVLLTQLVLTTLKKFVKIRSFKCWWSKVVHKFWRMFVVLTTSASNSSNSTKSRFVGIASHKACKKPLSHRNFESLFLSYQVLNPRQHLAPQPPHPALPKKDNLLFTPTFEEFFRTFLVLCFHIIKDWGAWRCWW
jgi:hypothetical protein